ncbi:MAG TPA: ATP-binding protein [Verrucomicrobiae bacterium]|nr:ATP-binding protein [Verrucomicrobiae bacterium]
MKTARHQSSSRPAPARELAKLRARLADAEETLRAIRTGEVDTVVVAGKQGPQVFTLQGAGHAYRVLIESMNEGALTLTADKMILYANQRFAKMVKCPLEQVAGNSFRRFLSAADRAILRPLLKRADKSGSKIQVLLNAGDGSQMPVQISIRPMAKNGVNRATISMVVTDMTEALHNEEKLRALSRRVVQAQEAERRLVALELHDNITQNLCAVLARWQALANKLPARENVSRGEMMKLSEMLGRIVDEAQRIARNLLPSILDEMGLVPALRANCTEFADRTGVSLDLTCEPLTTRMPAETELALYRILQKALENVKMHARARHVTVCMTKQGDIVQLTIKDDGIGFHPDQPPARRKERHNFGLLRMRERATYVGGTLILKSAPRAGTEILVRIPLPPKGNRGERVTLSKQS